MTEGIDTYADEHRRGPGPTTGTAPWPARQRRRWLAPLCWLLALAFALGGAAKFLPGESFAGAPYSEKFADWGYPSWFRFVVGSAEVVCAALLVVPRRRLAGATVLAVILVGALATHLVNQDPVGESVAAPVVLVLVGAVAWASRRQPGT